MAILDSIKKDVAKIVGVVLFLFPFGWGSYTSYLNQQYLDTVLGLIVVLAALVVIVNLRALRSWVA